MTPMGVNMTATAALEMKADSTKVTPYKIARIMTGLMLSTPPIRDPRKIIELRGAGRNRGRGANNDVIDTPGIGGSRFAG